jgi:hypothetical protein
MAELNDLFCKGFEFGIVHNVDHQMSWKIDLHVFSAESKFQSWHITQRENISIDGVRMSIQNATRTSFGVIL